MKLNSILSRLRMRRFQILHTFLIAVIVLIFSLVTQNAVASRERLFDTEYLKGIDTIYVVHNGGPNSKLMPWPPVPVTDPLPPNIFSLTVKEVFAQQPWVTITHTMEPTEAAKANVLMFQFVSTVQEINMNGKPVKLGTLSLQMMHLLSPSGFHTTYFYDHVIPTSPVSYPFVVPDTTEELNKVLAEGVRFLTAHLPKYFTCANKVGDDPCGSGTLPYGEDDTKRGISR